VTARIYDPFEENGHRYLASVDAEVAFAGFKKTTEVPFDQDELANLFIKACMCSECTSCYKLTVLELRKPAIRTRPEDHYGLQEYTVTICH
jgi:hypothetical protein